MGTRGEFLIDNSEYEMNIKPTISTICNTTEIIILIILCNFNDTLTSKSIPGNKKVLCIFLHNLIEMKKIVLM